MMMSLILIATIFVFIFLAIVSKRSRRKFITQKTLPSVPGLPFIGNLHQLGSLPHRSLFTLSKRYGALMLLHLGSIPTLVVSSPDLAQEFVRTHDIVFASRPALKVSKYLTYNNIDVVFSPYGECWREMKKICTSHLLSLKMVRSFNSVRIQETAQLLERISNHNGVSVCITQMFEELANNMLCRVILGSSLSDERRRLICHLVQQNSRLFLSNMFLEDHFPKLRWLDRILGLEEKLKRHMKLWDDFFDEFIEERLTNKSTYQCEGTYFIDVLLQLQKSSNIEFDLTKDHIKAALMDMFVAGTDTAFMTLDWSMAELIRNPDVMKKVQDEVRIIGNGADMINEEHLNKMDYLKVMIKEVLRLHPPAPLIFPRESTEDCEIRGYYIPKKTRVFINAWAIARDEANWDAPEEFRPERFLDDNINSKDKEFCYMPFGAGRRMCPGISFANAFLELVLANLLYRFDWKLPEGISIEDLDMEEHPGITVSRKQKLVLIPILWRK